MMVLPLLGILQDRLSKNGTDLEISSVTKEVDQIELFPALFLYEIMAVYLSVCAQILGQV